MRKVGRVVVVFVVGLLSSVVLGVAVALTTAVSLAATALIVPGTGTPNANIVTDYMQNARDRYMTTTECMGAGCTLTGIDYPATFWPIPIGNWCPGLTCDTWNVSVGTGVANLHQAIVDAPAVPDSLVLFGYSQGGAVVSDELRELANNPALLDKVSSVVMIGNIKNPDGGLWSRFSFLPTIPIWNVSFRPEMPTDVVHVDSYGFEYDPVMYAPLYFTNIFALLNAVAALETVHGNYLTPNGNSSESMAYGYTDAELAAILATGCPGPHCRVDGNGNTYWMIPAKSLPIADLVLRLVPEQLTPIVKPFVDLIAPTWKVLADLGYDWSGDPGVVRPLSLLPFNPFQNWVDVGVKLVVAAVEGVQAFLGDLGVGTTTTAPTTPTPLTTTTVSTLAASPVEASTTAAAVTEPVAELEPTAPRLRVVKEDTGASEVTEVTEATEATEAAEAVELQADVTEDNPATEANEAAATKAEETTKPEETEPSGTTEDDEKKPAEDNKPASDDKKADDGANDADDDKAAA